MHSSADNKRLNLCCVGVSTFTLAQCRKNNCRRLLSIAKTNLSSSSSMAIQHFSLFACYPFQTRSENNQGGRTCLHHSLQWAIGIQAFVFFFIHSCFFFITYNCITVVFAVLCSVLSHTVCVRIR